MTIVVFASLSRKPQCSTNGPTSLHQTRHEDSSCSAPVSRAYWVCADDLGGRDDGAKC
jgi:hypothetical protein